MGARLRIRLLLAASLSLLSQLAGAALPDGRLHANVMRPPVVPRVHSIDPDVPVTSRNGTLLPPYNTTYYFNQLINHNKPHLGTFKQRYWFTYEFYEPGGPIILTTPGEANADGYQGYLTNRTINGRIAQQQNGSTIVLEHRFYGLSNPYPNLSVHSFRVHTIHQAIQDLVYFAQNVHLPMPGGDQVAPGKAPWILIGGSYAGALTSWTMVSNPGVFFAGYASSAVVEAILDYWAYFEPIRLNMPQNCSADVQAVIAHVDEVFTSNNQTAIQSLKKSFGMGSVTHLDDVAGALRNNLWDWQSLQPTTGPNGQFFQFCDALEVHNGMSAPSQGWGLDIALPAWANYFSNTYLSMRTSCLGTYDVSQSYWSDISINNAWRSWFWIVCQEVGYLQEGAPKGYPTLVTRLINLNYDLRQCWQMFGDAYLIGPPSILAAEIEIFFTNAKYEGWYVHVDRLFFANGIRDPWKDATVSSVNHTRKSTPMQPIAISDGFHCSDLGTASGKVDPTISIVQAQALEYMKAWLATWERSTEIQASGNISISLASTESISYKAIVKAINLLAKGAGII